MADAASQLKNGGVDVFAIGYGTGVVPSQLEAIGSRPSYVFTPQTSSLPIVSSQIISRITQGNMQTKLEAWLVP